MTLSRKYHTVQLRGRGDQTCQGGLLVPREGGRTEDQSCAERAQGRGGCPYVLNVADHDCRQIRPQLYSDDKKRLERALQKRMKKRGL